MIEDFFVNSTDDKRRLKMIDQYAHRKMKALFAYVTEEGSTQSDLREVTAKLGLNKLTPNASQGDFKHKSTVNAFGVSSDVQVPSEAELKSQPSF